MNIGFTGTREGMTDAQAAVFEGFIERPDSFHHGSCRGADVQAARIVRKLFVVPVRIICHPGPADGNQEVSGVDDEVLPWRTHFARNRDIVNACDLLIACPWKMVPTEEQAAALGGTWHTINYARKKGKTVVIIWPDGSFA